MRVIVQVPLKGRSERIPGKNLRMTGGRPLFAWLLDRFCDPAWQSLAWPVVVDTDCDAVERAVRQRYGDRFALHRRHPWYGSNLANGNHLLAAFAHNFPDADIYVQAFVTAPCLELRSIRELVAKLEEDPGLASVTHVLPLYGFFWAGCEMTTPINHDPDRMDGMPRTQDAPIWREACGAYAVRREALLRTGVRSPAPRKFLVLDPREAADIDNLQDLESLGETRDRSEREREDTTSRCPDVPAQRGGDAPPGGAGAGDVPVRAGGVAGGGGSGQDVPDA